MRLHREISDDGSTPIEEKMSQFEVMLEETMGLPSQSLLDNLSSTLKNEYCILKAGITKDKNIRLLSHSEGSRPLSTSMDSLLKQRETKLRIWQLIIEVNKLLFELIPQFDRQPSRSMDKAFDALSSESITFLLSLLTLFKNYITISDRFTSHMQSKPGEGMTHLTALKGLFNTQKNDCLNTLQNVFQSIRQHQSLKSTHSVVNAHRQARNDRQGSFTIKVTQEFNLMGSSDRESSLVRSRPQLGAKFLSISSDDDKLSESRIKQMIEKKGWKLQRFGKEKADRANEILKEIFDEHINRILYANGQSATIENQQTLWLKFREKFIKLKRLNKRQNHQGVLDIRQIAVNSLEPILNRYLGLDVLMTSRACDEFADSLVSRLKQIE